MNKDIKFIYFDIGSVLITSGKARGLLSLKYDVPLDKVSETLDRYVSKMDKGEMSVSEYWEKVVSDLGITNVSSQDVGSLYESAKYGVKRMHDLAKELKNYYKVGLLTNFSRAAFRFHMEQGNIPNIEWDSVIVSAEIGYTKPDRRLYEYAREQAKVLPSEIFYIDDTPLNIQIAKEMGWNGLVFNISNVDEEIKEIREYLQI